MPRPSAHARRLCAAAMHGCVSSTASTCPALAHASARCGSFLVSILHPKKLNDHAGPCWGISAGPLALACGIQHSTTFLLLTFFLCQG